MPVIRDIEITLDPSLSFNQQVMNIFQSAFYELRRISSIHKYLIIDATKTNCVLLFSQGLTIVTASCWDHQNVLKKAAEGSKGS